MAYGIKDNAFSYSTTYFRQPSAGDSRIPGSHCLGDSHAVGLGFGLYCLGIGQIKPILSMVADTHLCTLA